MALERITTAEFDYKNTCIYIYFILVIQSFRLSRSCLLFNFLRLSLFRQKTLSEWTKILRALIILQFLLINAGKQRHPTPAMV